MTTTTIRIIVIGDSGVGKTQMMMRYCEDSFTQITQSTVGVDFKLKVVNVDGVQYKIQIWDTAGQERFRNIVENYYRRAQGIILVYDVTSQNTFDALPEWLSSIDKFAPPDSPIVLCGNKSDLVSTVASETGERFANEKGLPFFLTSAANGEGIEDAFLAITRKVLESGKTTKSTNEPSPAPVPAPATSRKKGKVCLV
jgi:small GTP-binding protein